MTSEQDLIVANMGLVKWVAQGFRQLVSDLDDLKQEGLLGLLHALRNYNPAKATKFSTYATKSIRNRMRTYMQETCSPIRIPSATKSLARRKRRERRPLTKSQTLTLQPIQRSAMPQDMAAPATELIFDDERSVLESAMRRLAIADPRGYAVVRARVLDGRKLPALAEEMELSVERVRQIQNEAFDFLRRTLEGHRH